MQVDSADEVAERVRQLRLFQPDWQAIGPDGRKEWLSKFQDWMLGTGEHIADVVQSETGATRADASIEAPATADMINYWARNAVRFLADDHPKPHNPLAARSELTTVYRPYSVVGVISPWNFPFTMPAMDVIPALAAGAAGSNEAVRGYAAERGRIHPRLVRDWRPARACAGDRLRTHGCRRHRER